MPLPPARRHACSNRWPSICSHEVTLCQPEPGLGDPEQLAATVRAEVAAATGCTGGKAVGLLAAGLLAAGLLAGRSASSSLRWMEAQPVGHFKRLLWRPLLPAQPAPALGPTRCWPASPPTMPSPTASWP